MITPVSDEDLLHVRGALAFGSTAYLGAFDAVIAELRALRVVADAAVRSVEEVGNLDLESALRDAGRLP